MTAASIEPQVPVAHGNEPEQAHDGEANPCGGWPSKGVAKIVRQCAIDALFNGAGKIINPEIFDKAAGEIRAVLPSFPRPRWPSEEVDRIARILDRIAFIKVKAAEAGRGDLSIVRYQNRCRDARKLAGEVLSALPRPPSEDGSERTER